MLPLKTEAKWLSSEPSMSRSAASSPDIATLAERFPEPLRDPHEPASTAVKPALAASGLRLVRPRGENNGAQSPASRPVVAPGAAKKSGPPVKGLITALVGIALVPTAILFVLLWQDTMRPRGGHEAAPAQQTSVARSPDSTGSAPPEQASSRLEVALSSPDRVEANAGQLIEFPIAIDATEALPARSIIAITALPEGASFSAGRPYGDSGWSLLPDEIGSLSLQLPAQSGAADLRLELVAGDGTVLAQSETQVSIVSLPPVVATVDDPTVDAPETAATGTAALQQVAQAEKTAPAAEAPPPPQRKPSSPVADAPAVKVNTVKVVTIKPPQQTRPHDGAYALGSPADGTSAEWMETKTAVDMHAKAEQSSETVKVAEGGVKMRVMARDKNWVQVTDPKTSTTGWIYNRFLKPTEPPAQ